MSADVPHFGRPGTSTLVHRGGGSSSEMDDGAYSAAHHLPGDSVDFSQGGSGSSSDMDWDLAADGGDFLDGLAAGTGNTGSAGGGELCFDDFLDLEGMSGTAGDELTDVLPDSFYFELGPVDGSASTTSASDDLDDLFSCHSSQQQQQQPLYHVPPSMGARPSATADSAATFPLAPGGSGDFLSSVPPPATGVQSSSAIARPLREQRTGQASTYPAAPLDPGAPESISDSELLRLEGISLKASPSRPPPTPHPLGTVSLSQHPTPHPRQGREGPATTDQHPTAAAAAAATTTTASAATNTAASAAARRPASTATTTTTSFFKAVASKIQQKAATVRSSKASSSSHRRTAANDPSPQDYNQSNMSTVAIGRPISPATSLPKGIKLEPTQHHHHQMAMTADPRLPLSPPNSATIPQGMSANFGSGMLEDPFGGVPVSQVHGMYRRSPHTPLDTPIMDDDKAEMYFSPTTTHMGSHEAGPVSQTSKAAWPSSQGDSQGAIAWANSFAQPDGSIDGAHWWDSSVDVNAVNAHFQAQNARNASYNLALHVHPDGPDMSYGAYGTPQIPVSGPDMSGMMMGMPSGPHHSRSSSSPVVHNAYTHLPPQQHHHMQHPQQHPHPGSQTERRPRMPRAPSAGTRHLQTPMRRQRPPSRTRRDSSSVSPTPQGRSRNSSGSSVVGGPVMASSIKKRRSFNATTARHHIRTASNGSTVGLGIDLSNGGGGGGGGFVNFTPSDKNVLMTGVAPSGSSKTKARREKEAQEKRRRMSEAAIKAVRDAGGDIDKLMEEGFTTY